MDIQKLKEEITEDILSKLELRLEVTAPYCDDYEVFVVQLLHNGEIIAEDSINNRYLGKGV